MPGDIKTSIHGRKIGLDENGVCICPAGFVSGAPGGQVFQPSSTRVAFFDDFDKIPATAALTSTLVAGNTWISWKGTTGTTDWTYTTDPNGIIVGIVGTTTASMVVSGIQLGRPTAPYKPNAGELYFECRLKTTAITNLALFAGFADLDNITGAIEMPMESSVTDSSANTFTTTTSDGVGFLYDTGLLTDNFWLMGVANDVDAVGVNLGVAPVANAYITLAMSISATGVAQAYINGAAVGSRVSASTTPTVALTPVIAAYNRTTSQGPTITVDYISISQLRA